MEKLKNRELQIYHRCGYASGSPLMRNEEPAEDEALYPPGVEQEPLGWSGAQREFANENDELLPRPMSAEEEHREQEVLGFAREYSTPGREQWWDVRGAKFTTSELRKIQKEADEAGILLPAEFNVNLDHLDNDDDNKLLPNIEY